MPSVNIGKHSVNLLYRRRMFESNKKFWNRVENDLSGFEYGCSMYWANAGCKTIEVVIWRVFTCTSKM